MGLVPTLNDAALEFLAERHLATLSTLRRDGTPHTVAIAFTFDPATGLARVITDGGSRKAHNVQGRGYAALTQVDGARWLTLEGPARVSADPDEVADAVSRYAVRYRQPRVNPTRVMIEIEVSRAMGSVLRA